MPDLPGNCAGKSQTGCRWTQTCAGARYRVISVGIGDRLSAARQALARIGGRDPDGIVLLDGSRRIVAIDSVASRFLDIDPRRVLGREFDQIVPDADSFGLVDAPLESGTAIGVFGPEPELSDDYGVDLADLRLWPDSAAVETLLSFETLDGLTAWLAEYLGECSQGLRGALALRDGETMVVWSAWPSDLPLLFPLRFSAMDSRAFRTGLRSDLGDFEPVESSGCTVLPVVVDGSVAALIAHEGTQPEVEPLLPALGMALRRFIE